MNDEQKKKFEEWFQSVNKRFYSGDISVRQIAFQAWEKGIEHSFTGIKSTLSIADAFCDCRYFQPDETSTALRCRLCGKPPLR